MSELTKALIGFHKAVDKIEKNARANYGKFADLANVLSTVTPPLHANGLVLSQTFLENSLVTTLHHVSGETLSSSCPLVICEGRNMTQEWGKAVTYQRRFAICSILGIVADMDTDDVPDLPPLEQNSEQKPAKTQKANSAKNTSEAFKAGKNAIAKAKTLKEIDDLSKRVAERKEQNDLSASEHQELITLLGNRQAVLKEQGVTK